MKRQNFFYIIAAVFIGMLAFLYFSNQHSLENAEDMFHKKEYSSALKELKAIKSKIPKPDYHLYVNYIERAEGNWDEADSNLVAAENLAQLSTKNLQLEIFLNEAFNAYLENNPKKMKEVLVKAKALNANNGWIDFFEGLSSCENNEFERALERWSSMKERPYLSAWMQDSFEPFFTKNWLSIHQAKCFILLGHYLEARQLLDKMDKNLSKEDLNKITFMLGYSYFREGMGKPLVSSGAFYKIATSYFGNLPLDQLDYSAERSDMVEVIKKSALQLAAENNFNDLPIYIKLLEMWGSEENITKLRDTVLQKLHSNIEHQTEFNIQAISAALNLLVKDKPQRDAIATIFTNSAKQALFDQKTNTIVPYWDAAKIFSSQPSLVSKELSESSSSLILKTLPSDDNQLTKTENLLGIWNAIQKDPQERKLFAKQLIDWAINNIKATNQNEKAINLIRLSFALPSATEQQELADYLERILHENYAKALSKNDPQALLAWLSTEIELNFTDIKPASNLQDYLKLAGNLYLQKKYSESLLWSKWILLQDPQNIKAKILAGLSDYQLGNTLEAFAYLKNIPNPPSEIKEPLFVSELLNVKEFFQKNYTENAIQQLSDNGKFELALGLINLNQSNEAIKLLNQVSNTTPEQMIAKAYAFYILEDWQNVLTTLSSLPPPYNQTVPVSFLRIRALIRLGNAQEAEREINQLERKSTTVNYDESSGFGKFKSQILDHFYRDLLSSIYYRDVKHDYPKALQLINQIKSPSNEVEVEKVVLFTKMQDYLSAKKTLSQILGDPNLEIQKRLLPLLTMINLKLNLSLDALWSAQKFFIMFPERIIGRGNLAELYMDFLRYDLAYDELQIIKQNKLLTPQNKVDRVASLIYLDQTEEAANEAFLLLAIRPGLPKTQILRLGKVLTLIQQSQKIQPTVDKVEKNLDELSFDEVQALLEFYLASGKILEAKEIAQKKIDLLQTQVSGLITLSNVQYHLSNYAKALEWLKIANNKAPFDQRVFHAITLLESNPEFYLAKIRQYNDLMKEFPLGLSFKLGYLQNAAKWNELNSNNLGLALEMAFDPHSLLQIITQIEPELKFLPELYSIKGRMLTLIGKEREALNAFAQALILSPSYFEPAIGLAKLLSSKGNLQEAHQILHRAMYFNPQNVEGWIYLSELENTLLDYSDSITSLEQAIKFQPLNASLRIKLSKVYVELENPEDARNILQKGLEYEPKNLDALTLLLQILYDPTFTSASGDIEEIEAYQKQVYKKIQAINPELADKTLEKIKIENGLQ